MNPFDWSNWNEVGEMAGYIVLVVICGLVLVLVWDMRGAARRRRQAKSDKDRDRLQDQ